MSQQTTIDDTFNGKNNVVTVKKSDFEVMDALDMDSMQPGKDSKNNTSRRSFFFNSNIKSRETEKKLRFNNLTTYQL